MKEKEKSSILVCQEQWRNYAMINSKNHISSQLAPVIEYNKYYLDIFCKILQPPYAKNVLNSFSLIALPCYERCVVFHSSIGPSSFC